MTPGEAADPFVPRSCRVARTIREDRDTVTIELERAPADLHAGAPGQFNMLYAFGVGEAAISISGDTAVPGRLVHTVRAVGAISTALATLKEGDAVGVRGPFGNPWPLTEAQNGDVLIVAGGLGLAPLRPVVYHLIAHRERFGRVCILVGMRTPSTILYRRELEQWKSRLDVELEVTVDHADASWRGNVGVVPALVRRMEPAPDRTTAMICGPEIMMRFSVNALRDAGIAPERIHLSMERNMKCAIGLCGHCQFGPDFVCRDGPVLRYDRIAPSFAVREA